MPRIDGRTKDEPFVIVGGSPKGGLDIVILDLDAQQVLLLWRGRGLLGHGFHEVLGLRVTARGESRPKGA